MRVPPVPGAGRIEASLPRPAPCHPVSAHFLSPVPLEILHARDLGCSWPWRLLGGTICYQPVTCFSQARLLCYSRALSLNWLKKKKGSSKSLSKTPTSFASFQSAGGLMEFPLGDFFPVSSLDRAQRRREGQAGRVREGTEIFPHIFAVSGAEAAQNRLD